MQLLLLICLLPIVLGHGSNGGMENGRTGRLKMHGKIMMVKGGEGSGSREDEGGWDEWSKGSEDNRKQMGSPMHGKKWWENDYPESGEKDMGKRHGRKPWSKMDGGSEEIMDKDWSMEDGDDEERGKWRKDGSRHRRGDRDDDSEERGKWRKDGSRHGRGDRDDDSEERGKWMKDGPRHGRGDRDDDNEERGKWMKGGSRHGRGDRDGDSEERGEWMKGGSRHGRGDRDGDSEERGEWMKGGSRHGRGDRDEDREEKGKWRKDGSRHGRDDRDGDSEEKGKWMKGDSRHGRGDRDEDDEERGKWGKGGSRHGGGDSDEETDNWGFRHGRDQRRHENRGYPMHQKWTHGGDSREDEVRRAYFKFFGRFNMMKGGREMMDREERRGSGKSRKHDDWSDDQEMMDREERHGSGKSRKHDDWSDDQEHDNEGEMMKEGRNKYSSMMIEKKLKKGMKMLYKQDPQGLGKLITLSFLKMCECEGDDAAKLLKKFVAKAEHSEDMDEDTKRPKLPEIPDFGTDTTAKIAFLKNLTEEQRKILFGYDLVKNMCEAAKTYIVKSKEFYDQYFTEADSMTMTGRTTITTP